MAGWSQEMIALLLRLDTVAATDRKLSFSVMATRINREFGTSFTRNAVAGRIRLLNAGTGLGDGGRKPRKSGAKPAEVPNPTPEPKVQQRCVKPKPARPTVAPPRVRSQPPAPPSAPQCAPVTLFERKPSQCRWPVNDGGPFLFCGAPKGAHDPNYCGYHRSLSEARSARRAGVGAP